MFYAKQISTNQMVTGSHSVPDPSQVFPDVDVSDIETGEISESDDNFNLKRIMVGFWGRKFPFEEYYND